MHTIKIKYIDEYVDISNYVLQHSAIPYIQRNRDYTLRCEGFKMTVASTVTGVAGVIGGQEVLVESGATIIFFGIVNKYIYNYEDMTYSIEVSNILTELQEAVCDYDTLHALIAGGSPTMYQYSTDYYSYKIVGVLYLLAKMFAVKSMTLDTTEIDAVDAFTGTGDFPKTYKYLELYFDEYQLYCIGQDVATIYTEIDDSGPANGGYWSKKKSLFDVASEIIAGFGLILLCTGERTYKVTAAIGNYTISDTDKYSYAEQSITASETAGRIRVENSASGNRADYYSTVHSAIVSTPNGGVGESVSFLNNFVVLYAYPAPNVSHAVGALGFIASTAHEADRFNLAWKKVASKILDYTEEKIECPIQVTLKSIVENYINQEGNSELLQEVY